MAKHRPTNQVVRVSTAGETSLDSYLHFFRNKRDEKRNLVFTLFFQKNDDLAEITTDELDLLLDLVEKFLPRDHPNHSFLARKVVETEGIDKRKKLFYKSLFGICQINLANTYDTGNKDLIFADQI
jgi:hypothetical protein